jgi:hypothetical protein
MTSDSREIGEQTAFSEVVGAFDESIEALSEPLNPLMKKHGWDQEKRDDMQSLLLEWRQELLRKGNLRSTKPRSIVRWFMDMDVDTEGIGQVIIHADNQIAEFYEDTPSERRIAIPEPSKPWQGLFRRRN